ncbi:hypothetical protein [Streptomyces violaceusniger]|uniref:hypothetical protein n=1 Tax=Streptomyces violaceusniger TaxID=68280 RepID=UPI0031DDA6DB
MRARLALNQQVAELDKLIEASDQRTRGCSREMADAIVGDPAVVVDVIGRLESGGTETPNGRAVS